MNLLSQGEQNFAFKMEFKSCWLLLRRKARGQRKKKKNGPNGLTVLPGHMAGESLVARSSEEEVEGKQHKGVFC